MIAIFRKEINAFFASTIGYLVIGVFLLVNGLFLWIFKGSFNILDSGVASLSSFFLLAPWILIFLVPAVTMRSFSDEKKQGTIELLFTKPISSIQIVMGKFFGAFVLVLITLLPTLLYVYSISGLSQTNQVIDVGSIMGSYFGLIFLIASYTAIGIFTSALSDNQVVAFLFAILICFIFYFGFEGLSNYGIFGDFIYVENLGMSAHFKSMSKGIIDTRDLIYFISLTVTFLVLTKVSIQKHNL